MNNRRSVSFIVKRSISSKERSLQEKWLKAKAAVFNGLAGKPIFEFLTASPPANRRNYTALASENHRRVPKPQEKPACSKTPLQAAKKLPTCQPLWQPLLARPRARAREEATTALLTSLADRSAAARRAVTTAKPPARVRRTVSTMRSSLLVLLSVRAQALTTPLTRLRQGSKRRNAASTAPHKKGNNAYRLASAASVAAWSACAVTALSRHPTLALPAAHARLSILQALTPLPLLTASFEAAPEDRTVQLGLAAASAWLCAAVVFAPHLRPPRRRARQASRTWRTPRPSPTPRRCGRSLLPSTAARRCSAARPTRRRRRRRAARRRRSGAESLLPSLAGL